MEFNEEDIHAITESVWSAILGLAVQPCPPPTESTADSLIGSVDVVGAWHGTMVVRCPTALARHVGAIMFGLEPGTATLEHAQDAMSEITNMIGGNLKALLPEPCQLLFPQITRGTDATTAPAGQLIARAAFECESDVFLVAVHEDEPPLLAASPQ
jgi:chemotaxis protein CheX